MKINKYNDFKNVSGSVLKELRKKNNLSQEDLAKELQLLGIELTSKEISKIENDNRLVQDFELFAFAKVFNVSADEFNKEIKGNN
jgi:transcriptional regulator with XRE-family HTH domain